MPGHAHSGRDTASSQASCAGEGVCADRVQFRATGVELADER